MRSNYELEATDGSVCVLCGDCWNKLVDCPVCAASISRAFCHGTTTELCRGCGNGPDDAGKLEVESAKQRKVWLNSRLQEIGF